MMMMANKNLFPIKYNTILAEIKSMTDRGMFAPDVFNYSADNTYDSYDQQPSVYMTRAQPDVRINNQKGVNVYIPANQETQYFPDNQNYQNYEGTSYPPAWNQYQRKANDYKYNIFSLADENWNRCMEVGSCGGCPSNEFVSSRTPKSDWF
jgi:hypothetical protein